MIVDQLFEDDDKKKKLNEIDPRNYDSDEDYYNDLHGEDDDEDFDPDAMMKSLTWTMMKSPTTKSMFAQRI